MTSAQQTTRSAQMVERFGYYAFVVMTSLLLICIAFGFYAVIDKFQEPNWKQACIEKGGVPVQLARSSFDCKGI